MDGPNLLMPVYCAEENFQELTYTSPSQDRYHCIREISGMKQRSKDVFKAEEITHTKHMSSSMEDIDTDDGQRLSCCIHDCEVKNRFLLLLQDTGEKEPEVTADSAKTILIEVAKEHIPK